MFTFMFSIVFNAKNRLHRSYIKIFFIDTFFICRSHRIVKEIAKRFIKGSSGLVYAAGEIEREIHAGRARRERREQVMRETGLATLLRY